MFLISIYIGIAILVFLPLRAMQPTRWTTTYSIGSFNSLSTYTNGLMVDIARICFSLGLVAQCNLLDEPRQNSID